MVSGTLASTLMLKKFAFEEGMCDFRSIILQTFSLHTFVFFCWFCFTLNKCSINVPMAGFKPRFRSNLCDKLGLFSVKLAYRYTFKSLFIYL